MKCFVICSYHNICYKMIIVKNFIMLERKGKLTCTFQCLFSDVVSCEITRNAKLMQQDSFINVFLARSGTHAHSYADVAVRVARHHPHRTQDLRSGSQDHHPSKNSVQKTICCNSTSNAPDDERMYPKHVELRIH